MATWRVNNSTLLGGEICAPWQPNHAYSLGARCVCRIAYGDMAARGYVYECTVAGTSHASTEPTWPKVVGNTVVDNGVTWTCRSPSGGNWDNASCILTYVLNYGTPAIGDLVYIDDGHSESTDLAATYQVKGSTQENNILRILCVDKADDSLSEGAVVYQSNSGQKMSFLNYYLYSYGITYKSAGDFCLDSNPCRAILEGSGTTILLELVNSAKIIDLLYKDAVLKIVNGSIKMPNANNCIQFGYQKSKFEWLGGSLIAANGVSYLLYPYGGNAIARIRDVDLHAVGNGANVRTLVNLGGAYQYEIMFERCKLPSDAGFTYFTSIFSILLQGTIRFHHCSKDNKTYDFYEKSFEGSTEDETTIVRTGGASDGTTPQSWKMITGTGPMENINPLKSPPIQSWTNSTVSKTFTVECILDSAANLQNDEVWMEFEYPVDNSSGLGGFTRDKMAMLGTPADKPSSSETWTTTGMSNPNKFKCQATVTPGKAGPITARICLAKQSKTIYVDPVITES